jgi:hypothetical protein
MNRVGALDPHRTVPLRVIRQDFLRDHVAGHESDDDLRADHGTSPHRARAAPASAVRALTLAQPGQGQQRHERVAGPLAAVVAGEQPHQPLQVAVQRGIHVHLHAEVFHHRDAARTGDPARRLPQQILLDPADLRITRHVYISQHRLDLLVAAGVL